MFGALAEWFGLGCSCDARITEAEITVAEAPEAAPVKGVTTPTTTTTTGGDSFGDPSPISWAPVPTEASFCLTKHATGLTSATGLMMCHMEDEETQLVEWPEKAPLEEDQVVAVSLRKRMAKAKLNLDALRERVQVEFLSRSPQNEAEEREMCFCTTSTMMRYLCASDGDVNKALKAMKDSMEWRRKNLHKHLFLEGATLPTCRPCLKDPLSHCFLCIGQDSLGRHVIYSCTGRAANKTPEDGIEHMATELERLFQNSSMPGQIAWVLDFAGFGLVDCNPKVAALALPMFASHYPERFGQIVCLSFPYAFYPLYAAGSRIFDKDTMAKVKILKSDKEWKRYGDAYWSHDPGMRAWLDEAVKCKGVPGSFPAAHFTEQLRRTPETEGAIRILERCATQQCSHGHGHTH